MGLKRLNTKEIGYREGFTGKNKIERKFISWQTGR